MKIYDWEHYYKPWHELPEELQEKILNREIPSPTQTKCIRCGKSLFSYAENPICWNCYLKYLNEQD